MTHAYIKHWDFQVTFEKALYHQFSHKAMNTTFEIWINHEDGKYAAQAAHEAFVLVDTLENNLSKFIPNSDISRINKENSNTSIHIDESTFQCLQKSIEMFTDTDGLFDISLGTGLDGLQFSISDWTLSKADAKTTLDLGGIGKGFAVDRMVDSLKEWDIKSAFIHGGASSVFAYGKTRQGLGWPITLSNPWMAEDTWYHLDMLNIAIGSSGLLKGLHILNPDTHEPVNETRAIWVSGPDAVTTDALSTTFMIYSMNQIQAYCNKNDDIDALALIKSNGGNVKIHPFGQWPT